MDEIKSYYQRVRDDLRNLNWRELYLLDYPYQIVVAIIFGLIAFLLLYGVLVSGVRSDLADARIKELDLKETYKKSVAKVVKIPDLEQDVVHISSASSNLLGQLPDSFSAANIVQEFYEAGAENGLRITVNKHLKPIDNGVMLIRPYEIETTGSYVQLERFCLALGQLKTVVILEDLQLTYDKNSSSPNTSVSQEQLHLKMRANTYQRKE